MGTRRYRIPNQPSSKLPGRSVAAALSYHPGVDAAPHVVASGEGRLAEKIVALAKENGVPIHEDPALAAALASLNPGDEIPPELYIVVSEVLVYIYRLAGKNKI